MSVLKMKLGERRGQHRRDAETDDQRGALSTNNFLFRPDDKLHLTPPSPLISRNGVQNRS